MLQRANYLLNDTFNGFETFNLSLFVGGVVTIALKSSMELRKKMC